MNFNTTAAKASFTSIRSISLIVKLAIESAFFVAGAGPSSIIVGSVEQVAADKILARGFKPSKAAFLFEPTNVIEAPSTIPDEFPAVCKWLISSMWMYFCKAISS